MATHFHPLGKQPSEATLARHREALARLPFDDVRDAQEAARGFLAAPPYRHVMADAGHVAWDMAAYDFLLEGHDFASVHPSLQRQAVLNMAYGLYEVVPDAIYQVRGFDLANITFVGSDTCWIVFDPLTARETAAAAYALVTAHLGERRVVTVVYSHSHGDHFGGVRGVVDQADVDGGRVPVIAPVGFLEHAVAEKRIRRQRHEPPDVPAVRLAARAQPVRPGRPGDRQGRRVGLGGADRPDPRDRRRHRGAHGRRRADGFPEHARHRGPRRDEDLVPRPQGLLGRGEHHRHDPQHLHAARRPRPRRPRVVAADQQGALPLRPRGGGDARVALVAAVGQRPHPGGDAHAARRLRAPQQRRATPGQPGRHHQRDPQRLPRAREPQARVGRTQLPRLGRAQRARGGEPLPRLLGRQPGHAHDAVAVGLRAAARGHDRRGGADPRSRPCPARRGLLPPRRRDPRPARARRARERRGAPAARRCLRAARLPARVGEGANSFLAAAFELRSGIPAGATPTPTGPDLVRALGTSQFLDFLGIRLDPAKAAGDAFTVNLLTPDVGESFVVELSHATLTNLPGFLADDPDLTITVDRRDLEAAMTGERPLQEQVTAGTVRLDGDASLLARLAGMLVHFELGFEILPGTGTAALSPTLDAFASEPVDQGLC